MSSGISKNSMVKPSPKEKKREDAVDQLKRLRAVGAFAHEYA